MRSSKPLEYKSECGRKILVDRCDLARTMGRKFTIVNHVVYIDVVNPNNGSGIRSSAAQYLMRSQGQIRFRNGDFCNLRRYNLVVERASLRSSSGFIGVTEVNQFRYVAKYKGRCLGSFQTPEDAARAYDEVAAKEGVFVGLNFEHDFEQRVGTDFRTNFGDAS